MRETITQNLFQVKNIIEFGNYNEFKENKPGLSNKVLSHCLKDMEVNNLIKRYKREDIIEYKLTERGQALNKVLYELAMFTLNSDLSDMYFSQEKVLELKSTFEDVFLNNKEDS